jgi:LuxR family maltose regulon positive regulatory protein
LPRAPEHVIERAAIDGRLDRWAPLTLVDGVPGAGKTTAVAEWLRRRDPADTIVWITLINDLARPAALLAHLRRRLVAAGVLDSAASDDVPVLVALAEALHDSDGRRLVIVLDNVHHMTDDALASDFAALAHAQPNLHLILIGSGEHPFQRVASLASENVTIGMAELLLRPEEFSRLGVAIGRSLTDAEVDRIRSEVGGWVAPARLMIRALAHDVTPRRDVDEYLRSVLRSDRGRALAESLARLALVDWLDAEFVGAAEDILPADGLELFVASGVLRWRAPSGRFDVTIPSAVRRIVLEAVLASDPDGARQFHGRMARWFARTPTLEYAIEAFAHACAAADGDLAHEIWSEHVIGLYTTYPARVAAALDALPPHELTRHPGLAATRSIVGVVLADDGGHVRAASVAALGESAERALARGVNTLDPADLLFLGTGRMIGLRLRGEHSHALDFGKRVASRMAVVGQPAARLETLRARFELQYALTWMLSGDNERAIDHYERAWQLGRRASPSYVPANAAANLALIHTVRGEASKAGLWLERQRESHEGGRWDAQLASVGAIVARGILALDSLDERAARAATESVGDGSERVELWPYVLLLAALVELHFGAPSRGLVLVDQAVSRHHPPVDGAAAQLTEFVRAQLLLAIGEAHQVAELVRSARLDGVSRLLIRSRLELLTGESQKALATAERVLGTPGVSARERLGALVLSHAAAVELGETTKQRRTTTGIVALLDHTRAPRALLDMPREFARDLALPDSVVRALDDAHLPYPAGLVLVELTRRERQLLEGLAADRSRGQLARAHRVSLNTVKSQLAALYRKLGVGTREDALERARRLGLLPPH